MIRALKASLLSAFIFPGSGHLYLKKYFIGVLLTGFSVASLYFLFSGAMDIAQGILVKVQSGEIPLDLSKIGEAILNQPADKTKIIKVCTYSFAFLWLFGILDSFRLGRSPENDETLNGG
jgi:hypothetical protein